MSSPFAFFRKNQKSMMVFLVIFAMLAFTLDQLFYSQENQFVLLGVLLGAGFFGVAGIGTGRWIQYGVGGAVLGALCGWMMPGWVMSDSERESSVSSSVGIFDTKAFNKLALQRSVADQFIMRAVEESFGQGMSQYATGSRFGFGYQTDREEYIFGELMRHEADKLGIVVTNDMVSDYVNQATDDKLTAKKFATIRNQMSYDGRKLTEEELFDYLREEIKAKMAFRMLHPQLSAMPPAPEVYYEFYRRLNVTQRVNAAAVAVDAFLSQVPEPDAAEVAAAFEKAKEKVPNQDGPGSTGFFQPRKVKLAYIELDEKAAETTVAAITDAEIEEYYNQNKDTLYRRPVAPEIPAAPTTTPAEQPATPDSPPADEPAAPSADPAPNAEKPSPEKNETPTPTPTSPAPEPEPAKENPAPAPADECNPFADETPAPKEATPPAEATKEPAAEQTDATSPANASETPAAKPADESEPAKTAVTPNEAAPPAAPALTIPAAPDAAQSETPFPEQKYETRPLDDELKAEIREQLLQRRVREAVEKTMSDLLAETKKLESDRKKFRFSQIEKETDIQPEALTAAVREYSTAINPAAKALAEKAGCAFVETPFVSFEDLYNSEDHPIGTAVPPGGNMFEPSGPDVANTVFSAPGDELQFYIPRRATRNSLDLDKGAAHYIWWVTDNSDPHVPKLDDPGIREEVVLALKREKARELAKKRAEELAAKVREGAAAADEQRVGMSAALESATVTGRDDAAKVSVRQSLPFTWIHRQVTSRMDFQQQPQLSLSGLEFADEPGVYTEKIGFDFMKSVFDDLANNEVGVVPNADLSSYYVVQIVDRNPTPELGEEELREKFLAEGKQSGFAGGGVVQLVRQSVAGEVTQEWQAAIWKKYGIDPEADAKR